MIEQIDSFPAPGGIPGRGTYLPYAAFEYLGRDFMGMDMAAMSAGEATIMDRGFPERIGIELVSANFFRVLGVEPALGRTFIDSDESGQLESAEPVCVISETLWQRRYNRDPDILGRQIFLNGESVTIVGVLPPGFESWRNERTELWALLDRSPSVLSPTALAGPNYLVIRLVARVPSNRSLAEVRSSAEAALAESPDFRLRESVEGVLVSPLRGAISDPRVERASILMLFAALLLMAIGVLNAGNLFAEGSISRGREIAIRVAVGATPLRVWRRLTLESLGLAGAASLLALIGAMALSSLIDIAYSGSLAAPVGQMSWRMFLASSGTVALFTCLCAAVVYWRPVRQVAISGFSSDSVNLESPRSQKLRLVLLAVQAALAASVTLYTVVAVDNLARLTFVEWGFDSTDVFTMRIDLSGDEYQPERANTMFGNLRQELGALNGINGVGISSDLPIPNSGFTASLSLEDGRRILNSSLEPTPGQHYVTPGFFSTLGIPFVQGQGFTDSDVRLQRPVAVIDETFARQYWPGIEPLGRLLRFDSDEPWLEVVGVVGRVRVGGPAMAFKPEVYLPFSQRSAAFLSINGEFERAAVLNRVREIVNRSSPGGVVYDVESLDSRISMTSIDLRFTTTVATILSSVGVIVALFGMYAFVVFSGNERQREIAIRGALGASRWQILHSELRNMIASIAFGLVSGTGLALLLSETVRRSFPELDTAAISGFAFPVAAVLFALCMATGVLAAQSTLSSHPWAILSRNQK